MGVEDDVALPLPTVGLQLLAEVALVVEEADADEGHAEAAGRLQVVAGQYAQAAGVLGQRLGDAELGGEVGHRAQRALPPLEPAVGLHVTAQVVVDLGHERQERPVGGQGLEPEAVHVGQEPDRVVTGHLPGVGVDPAEQVLGPLVPGPAEVHGQGMEGRQPLGKPWMDGEAAECPHRVER